MSITLINPKITASARATPLVRMQNIVRGSNVNLTFVFSDDNYNTITSVNVSVTLSYVPLGDVAYRMSQSYPMTPDSTGVYWSYDWDSSVAQPEQVDGHVVATSPGQPTARMDFSFRLIGNMANRMLFGDWDYWDAPIYVP